MSSLSFDPLAHIYDATRGYPESVARQIALGIEKTAHATPQTKFLEVGVGTGRIAFPLASRGHSYTGVDISEKMVEMLETKLRGEDWQEEDRLWGALPDEDQSRSILVRRFEQQGKRASMRLVIADMTHLPFHDASFDVIVAVHVFHLVDGWQQAVEEVLRVVRPGGLFLHCWDEHMVSDVRKVEAEWPRILQGAGGTMSRPGTTSRFMVSDFLRSKGLHSEEIAVVKWAETVTPREAVERFTKHIWSGTLHIPDAIFALASQRLQTWANNYYGNALDKPYQQERRFMISKVRV